MERTVVNVTKDQLEKSILSKVRNSIDLNKPLKVNHRLIAAVKGGEVLEAVRELTVMTPDLGTEELRKRFVSPLSELYRNAAGRAAQATLQSVDDEVNQLLSFAPSDVA